MELAPFKSMINAGVPIIMVAHLAVPALDPSGTPASLSFPIVTKLLKEELGFEGIVMTDALIMKAVASLTLPEEINLQALLAGNDLLIFPQNIPETIALIKQAIKTNLITKEDITKRAHKILKAKEFLNLTTQKSAPALCQELVYQHILQRVYDAATTI